MRARPNLPTAQVPRYLYRLPRRYPFLEAPQGFGSVQELSVQRCNAVFLQQRSKSEAEKESSKKWDLALSIHMHRKSNRGSRQSWEL